MKDKVVKVKALYCSSTDIEPSYWGRRKGGPEEDIWWTKGRKVHARKEGHPHRKQESKERCCLTKQGGREQVRTNTQFVVIVQWIPCMCLAYILHCKFKWSGVISDAFLGFGSMLLKRQFNIKSILPKWTQEDSSFIIIMLEWILWHMPRIHKSYYYFRKS